MIGITLRQLHYFNALARLGHFGRAAEACGVSQPALSMQIQELEGQLGVVLLERGRKGISLTPHGRLIAEESMRIIIAAEDLVDMARRGNQPLSGQLRLGIIPTVAPYLLPALLPELRAAFPDIQLQVRESQTATLLAELIDSRLDVALVALPVAEAELESLALIEDVFFLAVPRDYRHEITVDPALLRGERLLLLEEGHCFRDQAITFCSLQQSQVVNSLGASSFGTMVRMVAHGHGITFLPEIAVSTEVRGDEIRLIRFPAPEPKRILGLVWRRTSQRKRDFAALGRMIQACQPGARRVD